MEKSSQKKESRLLSLLKKVAKNGLPTEERKKIASELFNNYGIECGDKTFRFAEIEFYYYDSNAYMKNKEQLKWQKVTYPRDGFDAGQLFYHLSGIDICFDSHYNENEGKFGGILIRAIKDEGDKIIAGPLNCKDEILNACKGGNMPKLTELEGSEMQNITPKQTYRSLGKTGTDKDNDRLCFFDDNIEIDDWNPQREKFITEKGETLPKKGSYDTSKFDIKE